MQADKSDLFFNAPDQAVFGGPRDRSYPAPVEMLHLSIIHRGPGIDDLVNFYSVVLNQRFVFKITYPTFEFIALSQDDENHRIGFVNVIGDEPPGGIELGRPKYEMPEGVEPRNLPLRPCRIEHSSWLYRDFEAILLTAKRIHAELGIWPRTTRHDGIDLTIDYDDPDGNRVELLSQTPSKNEILFRLYRSAMMSADERRQYSDTYTMLSMEKLAGLHDAGVPLSDLQSLEYCKALQAEGKL